MPAGHLPLLNSGAATLQALKLFCMRQGVGYALTRSARARASASARRRPLSADHLAFIESYVSLKEFHSADQFFDAALTLYRKHVLAVNAYAD